MLTSDKVNKKTVDATENSDVCPDCDPKDPGKTWREVTQGVLVGMCSYHGMFTLKAEEKHE